MAKFNAVQRLRNEIRSCESHEEGETPLFRPNIDDVKALITSWLNLKNLVNDVVSAKKSPNDTWLTEATKALSDKGLE